MSDMDATKFITRQAWRASMNGAGAKPQSSLGRLLRSGLTALITSLAALQPAYADQYRSEVRELERPPPEQTEAADPAELLKTTTDPYARALLLREMAGQAARGENLDQAAKYLEQALAQNSLSGVAADAMREDLAQIYAASGDHDQVIRMLEPRYRANPDLSPEQLVALGAAYVAKRQYRQAIPLIRTALSKRQRPDESWRAALLAAYMGDRQYTPAAELVAELVREYPNRGAYWEQWAALLLRAGNKTRATAVMAIAARQGHLDTPEARFRLVALTAEIGAPFEAGGLLQTWMDEGQLPVTAQNWEAAAGIWAAAKEWSLAITAIEQAIALKPRAALYLQLGQLHMDREEYGKAAAALERAISGGAANGPVLMTLGMAEYQTGNVDAAMQVFQKAQAYGGSKALAKQWTDYLANGQAREQALAAASRRSQRDWGDDQVALVDRLGGGPVQVGRRNRGSGGRPVSSEPFTPVGAERPANASGEIPGWSGGLLPMDWPQGHVAGGKLLDPYPQDQPLFEISARNVEQYGNKVSAGHRALMARHPEYRLPIYPSRRSAVYPEAIYQASQKNLGRAKLEGSDALGGAFLGFPFPKPDSGVEAVWNHRTRYRGDSYQGQAQQFIVQPDGSIPKQLQQNWKIYYRYGNVADPVDIEQNNILVYGLTWLSQSGLSPEFVVLFHETANSIKKSRNLWVLLAKVGRMFRIPPVGYDQPFPESDGLFFIDQIDMYNGAFDRYVWKLKGKREMYVPYNSYRLSSGQYKYNDILQGGFLNPETTRYELHRVWVIEATERSGKKHVFGKRVFYVDEDSWNIVMVENHDRQERLWRFQEGHLVTDYERQFVTASPIVVYDVKDGRYFVNGLTAEEPPPEFNIPGIDNQDFLPARVKTRYSR